MDVIAKAVVALRAFSPDDLNALVALGTCGPRLLRTCHALTGKGRRGDDGGPVRVVGRAVWAGIARETIGMAAMSQGNMFRDGPGRIQSGRRSKAGSALLPKTSSRDRR